VIEGDEEAIALLKKTARLKANRVNPGFFEEEALFRHPVTQEDHLKGISAR
jgi:hypothetical protein